MKIKSQPYHKLKPASYEMSSNHKFKITFTLMSADIHQIEENIWIKMFPFFCKPNVNIRFCHSRIRIKFPVIHASDAHVHHLLDYYSVMQGKYTCIIHFIIRHNYYCCDLLVKNEEKLFQGLSDGAERRPKQEPCLIQCSCLWLHSVPSVATTKRAKTNNPWSPQ